MNDFADIRELVAAKIAERIMAGTDQAKVPESPPAQTQSTSNSDGGKVTLDQYVNQLVEQRLAERESDGSPKLSGSSSSDVSPLPPANASQEALTLDTINKMSIEEINANWEQVSDVIASAPLNGTGHGSGASTSK